MKDGRERGKEIGTERKGGREGVRKEERVGEALVNGT